MTDSNEYLTRQKFKELQAELTELKSVKRKEVAESLEYAKSLGDLSENAEYQEARELQANIEERIMKLENLLNSAKIVESHHTSTVEIGSMVVVQKGSSTEKIRYNIVGSEEADMAKSKLSNRSPLGQAMLGKKKGDSFTFKTPTGQVGYKIIDIE